MASLNAMRSVILVSFIYCGVQTSEQDPCLNHATFPKSLLGSRNEQCAPSPRPMCDYYLPEDWYRVEDATILTHCPASTCGFAYPAWMDGNLPTVAEGIVNRQICIKLYSDCCNETMTIRVKQCQGFHVLHLKPFDMCPAGYCFESTLACDGPLPEPSKPVVDPCENPSVFPTHNFGSRNEHCEPQSAPACDFYLQQDWYSVNEGNLLAHCPSGSCGVGYPVWLNGSFPQASDGVVERNVCIKDYADCCKSTVNIQMKKCNHGFVYNLPPLDFCPSVYCFESNLPCTAPRRPDPADEQRTKDGHKKNPDTLLIVITVLSSLLFIMVSAGLITVIYKRYNRTPPSNAACIYQSPSKVGAMPSDKKSAMLGNISPYTIPSAPPAYQQEAPLYEEIK